MTALTIYFTSTAATTITTADTILENATTGASTTSKNTTVGTSTGWGEVFSQGTLNAWGAGGSAPSPSGNGFIDDGTTFPTQQFIAGTWTATVKFNTNSGSVTADIHVRAYKRTSGGVYTLIADMVLTGQSITTTAATYSPTVTTGSVSTTFATGDKLYVDVLLNITSGGASNTVVKLTESSSSSTGSTSAQVVTPGYQLGATATTKDISFRSRLSQQVWKDISWRSRLSQQSWNFITLRSRLSQQVLKDISWRSRLSQQVLKDTTIRSRLSQQVWKFVNLRGNLGFAAKKDIAWRSRLSQQSWNFVTLRSRLSQQVWKFISLRGNLGNPAFKDITFRARIPQPINKDITFRSRLNQQVRKDITLRSRLSQSSKRDITFRGKISAPRILSGGFTIWANGTGTASFDHFRVTQFPDPSLCLAPILPRAGSTLTAYNDILAANTTFGEDVSLDGVNWTDVTSQNGGSLPGIYSQPDPTIDGFTANTSANYTSTFRTGGSAATWTFDTSNSRLVATGGVNAIYASTLVNRADVDFFADLDRSDAGGLVWRFVDQNNYYWLDINDSLTSPGPNTVTLYKVAANVQTQLATAAISYTVGPSSNSYTVTFTRGTYRRFRVSMLMGVITAYVDGVQLLTYTDSSPLGAGLVGLYNNGGTVGSRYYQLWIQPIGDYVTGTPSGDIVTSTFVYTRQRLATTDPSVVPQVLDVTTMATAPTIGAGVSIPSVTYNASPVGKNIDDLAKQSNYSWFIDQNKTANFRSRAAIAAPWILQSSSYGLVITNDLEVDSNLELDVGNDLYRNRQTILGANDSATFTEIKIGDGNTRTWTLGYPVASTPALTLNGIAIPPASVGVKGTTGFRYYYAIGDPVITQDVSQVVLQATDQLTITYAGSFGVTIIVDDLTEQAARAAIEGGTGIVEDTQDVTGQGLNKSAAITLANQLINRYAIAGRTLIFDTTRDGLAVGQMLTIFLQEQGIWDGQFFITQVEISLMKGVADSQIWMYKVTASELPKQASWAKLLATGIGLQ